MIFARQGGGRRKADALQGRQRSIAKIRPQRLSTFSQELVLVCDGATWHKSKGLNIAENIEMASISPYTPEMNPIEQIWK